MPHVNFTSDPHRPFDIRRPVAAERETFMSYPSPVAAPGAPFTPLQETVRTRVTATRVRECPVCLGQHEDEIHTATLRVRRWFRFEVTKGLVRRPVN